MNSFNEQDLAANRNGLISEAQRRILGQELRNENLGLGPFSRLVPQDAKLRDDLAEGRVEHTRCAVQPRDDSPRAKAVRGALGFAVDVAATFITGSTPGQGGEHGDAGSSPGGQPEGLLLYSATGERLKFVARSDDVQTITELGCLTVHHLPRTRRILSFDPADGIEPPPASVF